MAAPRQTNRFQDGQVQRQFDEVLRASRTVQIGPDRRDLADDGTPANDVASVQEDARFYVFESKGVGVAVEVSHSLGRVPCGFVETAKRHAGGLIGIPNDQSVNRAWTSTKAYLVPQTPAGTKHHIKLF